MNQSEGLWANRHFDLGLIPAEFSPVWSDVYHFLLWNTAGDWVNAERSAHAQKCWEVLLAPDLAPCPTKEHYVTLQYMYITDSLWFSWLHFWGQKENASEGGRKKVCVWLWGGGGGGGGGRGRQIMHQSACMPSRELIGFQCPVNHTGSPQANQTPSVS